MTVTTDALATGERTNEYGHTFEVHEVTGTRMWCAWCDLCVASQDEISQAPANSQPLYAGNLYVREIEGMSVSPYGGSIICLPCAQRADWCECCGGRFTISGDAALTGRHRSGVLSTLWIEDSESYWCPVCVDDYSHWCDCGAYSLHVSDSHYCTYDDDGYDDGYGDGRVHDYSYTPRLNFHRAIGQEQGQTCYFGVEVEQESVMGEMGAALDSLYAHYGHEESVWYCKHDSSIDNGFEMVSHPGTLEWWHEHEPVLDAVFADLRKHGMRSWNTETCGIHVHVSRKAFDGDKHLWLFQQLFYRNADALEVYAGRDTASWGNLKVSKGFVGNSVKARKRGNYTERYVAINLNPANTVECRIFRGSLNPTRLLADIELVAAAVEYSRNMTSREFRAGAWRFDKLAAWAIADGRFPHILQMVTPVRKNPRAEIEGDVAA